MSRSVNLAIYGLMGLSDSVLVAGRVCEHPGEKRKLQHIFFRLDGICASSLGFCWIIKKLIADDRCRPLRAARASAAGQPTHQRPRLGQGGVPRGSSSLSRSSRIPNRLSCPAMAKGCRSPAALLIDANKNRPPPDDARARMAERDARLAADTRSDVQVLLGDPPLSRSALQKGDAQLGGLTEIKSAAGIRCDLFRRRALS
jgi:hypothetical protein